MKHTPIEDTKICVIGLGYVGLPLARLFSTKYPTVGFDMNRQRVDALMAGHDATLEVSDELLQEAIGKHGFRCTADLEEVRDCNFYVVAVPTPVDENNRPDLKPLWGGLFPGAHQPGRQAAHGGEDSESDFRFHAGNR